MIHTPTISGKSEIVVFEWATKFGTCYDCGCPAAYVVDATSLLLCSVCAASHASDGEKIRWLGDHE